MGNQKLLLIKLPCCSFVCPRPTSLANIPLTATPFLGEFFLFLLVFLAFNDFFLFLFSDFSGGLFSITRELSACWVSGVKFVKLYSCLLSSSLRSGVNSEIIDKKPVSIFYLKKNSCPLQKESKKENHD